MVLKLRQFHDPGPWSSQFSQKSFIIQEHQETDNDFLFFKFAKNFISLSSYIIIINSFYIDKPMLVLIVCFCLFPRILHSYGDVTITGKGRQIMTFILLHTHWAPLSSEGSLARHTNCYTGHSIRLQWFSENPCWFIPT